MWWCGASEPSFRGALTRTVRNVVAADWTLHAERWLMALTAARIDRSLAQCMAAHAITAPQQAKRVSITTEENWLAGSSPLIAELATPTTNKTSAMAIDLQR